MTPTERYVRFQRWCNNNQHFVAIIAGMLFAGAFIALVWLAGTFN